MKNRILCFILSITVSALALTGCATGKNGASANADASASDNAGSSGNSEKQVKLRVYTMFGGTDGTAIEYEKIKEEFQKNDPSVIIEDDSRTVDEEWKQEVAADFSSGNEPDVIQFFTDASADNIVDMDKFMTVDEIRKEYPEYGADITTKALDTAKNTDGIARALPTTGYWEGLYCNRDLFRKYGLELPYSWDLFLKAIHAFQKNGVVPVSCSLTNVPHYWMEYLMLYAAGEDEYIGFAGNKTYTYDMERGLETFEQLRNLGAFPDDTDTMDNASAQRMFINKEAAMILEGNWFLPSVEDQDNTVVVPFPGIKGQKAEYNTVIGGMTTGFYITRRAWNNPGKRDAAVRFVMANTSKEAVTEYWHGGGGVSQAAVEINMSESQTQLERSATEYIEDAGDIVLSTDSRISPNAYKMLVSGVLSVSHGGSARELLTDVREANAQKDAGE